MSDEAGNMLRNVIGLLLQLAGVSQERRRTWNFIGPKVTDNPSQDRLDVDFRGMTVEESGSRAPVRCIFETLGGGYTRVGNVITSTDVEVIPVQGGVTLAVGDRVLVNDGNDPTSNWIYRVTSLGSTAPQTEHWSLERATDSDTSEKVTPGASCYVHEGTYAGSVWRITNLTPIELGTDDIAVGDTVTANVVVAGMVAATGTLFLNAGGTTRVTIGSANVALAVPPKVPSYTVAQANALSDKSAGQIIWVSNHSGGARPAISTGSAWQQLTVGANIS